MANYFRWYVLQLFSNKPMYDNRFKLINDTLVDSIKCTCSDIINIEQELTKNRYKGLTYTNCYELEEFNRFKINYLQIINKIESKLDRIKKTYYIDNSTEIERIQNIWDAIVEYISYSFRVYYLNYVMPYEMKWYITSYKLFMINCDRFNKSVIKGDNRWENFSVQYDAVIKLAIPDAIKMLYAAQNSIIDETSNRDLLDTISKLSYDDTQCVLYHSTLIYNNMFDYDHNRFNNYIDYVVNYDILNYDLLNYDSNNYNSSNSDLVSEYTNN